MNKIKKFFSGIKEEFTNYRKTTKDMTLAEKLGYLKDYYLKGAIIIGVVIACIVAIIVTSTINRNTEYIIFGTAINVDLTTDGTEYIVDDFYKLKKTKERQKVDFSCVTIDDFSSTNDAEASYYSAQSVIAQVSAQRLDYFLMDEVGFQYGANQELYMDLRDILSEKEMEEWADKIVYVQEEEGSEMFPTGINISDTDFIKENYLLDEPVFLAFAANAPHKEMAYEFFHYLLAYKSEK